MARETTPVTPAQAAGEFLTIGLEDPELTPEGVELLNETTPFGIILFARNMPDRKSLLAFTSALREHGPGRLLAIDHEGGRVDRLPDGFTHFPPALDMVRKGDPGLLREVGVAHGRELRAAGFDINFAPVLDVDTNPDNPIIGDRAFGRTPEEVAHFALPYLQGLTEAGVVGCGKHFPGHGDTSVDSHLELPCLPAATHDAGRLRRLEMRPFARAIAAGVPMLMTAHILCEALDAERPATLSKTVLGDCLRGEFGFGGVIVSDDLEMRAIADHYSVGWAAVESVRAGCDIVLVCRRAEYVREAHGALTEAIASGEIDSRRIEASRKRRAKIAKRASRAARHPVGLDAIGAAEHIALRDRFTS